MDLDKAKRHVTKYSSVSIHITRELDIRLGEYCKQHDLYKNKLVALLITDFLSKNE